MAVYLVNASGFQWAIEADEVGLNTESVSVNAKPEFKEWLYARDNTKRGFAVAPPELSITIKGDRSASTYPFASNFYTAVTLVNDHALVGATGDVYLDEATEDQTRSSWRSFEGKLSSNAGVTGTGTLGTAL